MIQVRTEAIHISNKYKIQIEPIQFEWDRFLSTSEQDLPEILNEMLICYSQQQPLNSNEKRSNPNENREQYNGRIENRTKRLTTLSPSTTHLNMASRFQYMSHSMPETTNTYSRNCHFTNCTYQGTQNRNTPHQT